jgi:hypothetical protein
LSEKHNEYEVKQKREWRSRSRSIFVTPKVEKSNFYRDLERVAEFHLPSKKE